MWAISPRPPSAHRSAAQIRPQLPVISATYWLALLFAHGLIAAPLATAQQAVLPLRLQVDTTSEWVRIELRGLVVQPLTRTLTVSGGVELAGPLVQGNAVVIRKPLLNLSKVALTLDLAVMPTGAPLQVAVTRGNGGDCKLKLTSGGRLLAADSSTGMGPLVGNLRLISLDLARFGLPLLRRDWGRRVLAFYYGWWGTPQGPTQKWLHWEPTEPHKGVNLPPVLGLYDSLDGATLHTHTSWAKMAGIDTLVLSLWQRDVRQDALVNAVLNAAEHDGLTATVYLETAENADDLRRQLVYLLADPMRHPAWLTVHGQKVVFVYTRVFDTVDAIGYRKALEGLPILAIGDRMDPKWLTVFDGLHSYISFNSPPNYAEDLRLAQQHARLGDKLVVATVTPGYDDTHVRFAGTHLHRRNGDFLRDSWKLADSSDWVILTSFNELHEGSQIEPTAPEGDLWLRRMRHWTNLFKGFIN